MHLHLIVWTLFFVDFVCPIWALETFTSLNYFSLFSPSGIDFVFVLISGVVSHGPVPSHQPNKYGIYTKLTKEMLTWIRETIANNPRDNNAHNAK